MDRLNDGTGGWILLSTPLLALFFGWSINQAQLASAPDRPGAGFDPQFTVNVVDMRLDGALRQCQVGCNLGVRQTLVDQAEHLDLALAERIDQPGLRNLSIQAATLGICRF